MFWHAEGPLWHHMDGEFAPIAAAPSPSMFVVPIVETLITFAICAFLILVVARFVRRDRSKGLLRVLGPVFLVLFVYLALTRFLRW
jgi:threonine/homoserine/homoserine lactone efflux protein